MAIALILAAHPDDELLGCGGTIERMRVGEGHEVYTHIIGKGRGDPEDQRFDAQPLVHYVEVIEAVIKQYQPETVFTHWVKDLNRDHRIIAEATLVATRPLLGQCVKSILAYEIPGSSDWGENGYKPNVFKNISAFIDTKLAKIKAMYDEEMRPWPHPRSYEGIRNRAAFWGSVSGFEYAEAFILVRSVR